MQVALIPHVVWSHNDDRKPLSQLYEMFKDTGRVVMIEDHNAEELKGYIARCRLMVVARTHASIAAYSTQVPTLVVGYSVKARGIAKDIFGSIIVGSAVGFVLLFITRPILDKEARVLTFALSCLFLSTGICDALNLDNILAAMSLGFVMVNFAPPKAKSIFILVDKYTPPIYVLFFVLVGAKLNIWIITSFLCRCVAFNLVNSHFSIKRFCFFDKEEIYYV